VNVNANQTASLSNTASVSSSTADPNGGNNAATETTGVSTAADVSVAKSDGVSNVTAGAATIHTYVISVSNAGPSDAQSVNLADTWPTGFTRGTVTTTNGTCDTTTSTTNFTCALGTIAAGTTATVMAQYTVPASTNTNQTNTATIASPTDSTGGNNTSSDTDTVSANPTVTINQAAGQNDPTNTSPIRFTATFSQPVTGFDGSDVNLSGSAGATTAVVTGGPSTYTVSVSGMANDGTVIASIPAGAAMNAFGDASTASTSTDNTVTYDTTGPSVTINQAATQNDPANTSPIHFTVHFSQAVTDFDSVDVMLSGTAGATTAVVSGSGQDYDVAVSGMTSDGTVIASVPAGGSHDAAGNANTASTSTDNTVTYDTTVPTVTINQAATQTDPTSTAPIAFTVVFSEPVSGFGNGSMTINGTTGVGCSNPSAGYAGGTLGANVYDSGDHKTYTVKVNGMTTTGNVVAAIAANRAQDAAGNNNLASTSTDNCVTWNPAIGNNTPTVYIDSPPFGSVYAKGSASITLKAHFTDPDNGP